MSKLTIEITPKPWVFLDGQPAWLYGLPWNDPFFYRILGCWVVARPLTIVCPAGTSVGEFERLLPVARMRRCANSRVRIADLTVGKVYKFFFGDPRRGEGMLKEIIDPGSPDYAPWAVFQIESGIYLLVAIINGYLQSLEL